ncbi:putative ribonuclease H-like domain-containing protein [Tanacetum coccineum]|uniref:Ribonuclease H-like domain-containing protein n=1 Tax=Tanacetum coccineum TaxID=301880 RepID=A0ABQ4WIL8_9ASTR
MDDLYNNMKNLKIYEAKIMGSSSTNQNTQNIAFVSSNVTSSTNEAVKTYHGVSTANSKNNASTLPNLDSLNDVVIYSFFASQSNSSQLDNEDLKQIDPDDLEEMYLKWQMAMLIMRARRFLKKIGRNLGVNGTDTIGFDKTKVECYNCHIRGHFARECRAPKNQDNRNRETTRRIMPVEETTSNALVSQCDGLGAYKAGLESVEARLDVYKKNEVVFEEDIKILKLDIMLRDNALTELRKKFEKAKKERNDLKLTLEKFENSSKSLSKLLDSQISDKFKSGLGFDSQVVDSQVNDKYKTSKGYHAVFPPYTENFMPPKPDLVVADKDEYVFSESVTSVHSATTSEVKPSVSKPKESIKKVENNEQAKYPRKNSQSPRDCDFYEKKMVEKPVWNNARRVNHQNSQKMTHPHPKRNFVPRAVLIKSGLKTLNTAGQNSSRAAISVNTARPINTAYP